MPIAKITRVGLLTVFLASIWSLAGVAGDGVYSLRGKRAISDLSEMPVQAGILLPLNGTLDRSYRGQPPQVPHKVKAKRISLKKNQCLECHGDENYQEIGTTKVHDSHFFNRAGEQLGRVSTRFYFCNQCHVEQANKTPLVANSFATSSVMKVKRTHRNDVLSLRGARRIDDSSSTPDLSGIILPIKGVHDRSYKGQPPLIPHKVKAKRISLKKNQCLSCHSELNHEEIGATQVHKSHFVNRAGERLGKVSTRFYFCTQCHAQQADRAPLVANRFRTEQRK